MANHSYQYKGHQISIEVDTEIGSRYKWSYRIDAGHQRGSRGQGNNTESKALEEAMEAAQHEADRLLTEPTITNWGKYSIQIRTGTQNIGSHAGEHFGSYRIFSGDVQVAHGSVVEHFGSAREAADNALAVAKRKARESLEGPFPESE